MELSFLSHCLKVPDLFSGELLIEVDSGGRFSALRHTPTVSDCIGTIQIFTKSRSRISRITLPGNANANFFKRSTMDNANSSLGQIVLVRTFGNCCWTIFERESRKGNKIHLEMGRQWRPSFQPAAFLKYECWNHFQVQDKEEQNRLLQQEMAEARRKHEVSHS